MKPNPVACPFNGLIDSAHRFDSTDQAEAAAYIDAPGAALLQALNQRNNADAPGAGVFAMRVAGHRGMVAAIIAPDRRMVCDPQLISESDWQLA
jgi:hypothetical protein